MAPLRLRFLALIIDGFIGSLPIFLIAPIALIMMSSGSSQNQFVGYYLLLLSVVPALIFFLIISSVQVARGRPTVGRRVAGLQLEAGNQPSGPVASLRRGILFIIIPALLLLLGLSPVLYLLLPIWVLIDKRGRAPWDILAGLHLSKQLV